MNTQDWAPSEWTGWISLLLSGLSKNLLQHNLKASILQHSAPFIVQLSHPYMITGKTIALTRRTFVGKVISLLFNMLSRLVITFLPRRKRLLISWLQTPSAVTLEPPKNKVSHCFPIYLPWSGGMDIMILVFWMLSFKPTFVQDVFYYQNSLLCYDCFLM